MSIYSSKDDYYKKVNHKMSSESILSMSIFNFYNAAIINCVIKEVLDNEEYHAPDRVALMYCSINNVEMDVMVRFERAEQRNEFTFKPGQILSAICAVEIWPENGMTLIDN
jgi:hypothetical protein